MRPVRDLNAAAAFALADLALLQTSEHARIAYRRASRAVLDTPWPVEELAEAGTLRELRHVGPSSERVIRDVLANGESAIVARAVAERDAADKVAAARALRNNFLSRAAVRRVLAMPAEGVVSPDDYRGDLQLHTRWSDGRDTIAEMAAAARARGYRFLGVTDHGYGLPIAGGISMDAIARQRQEIDALNAELAGAFTVLAGIEANLLADGRVDMQPDELAVLDFVVAAPHSVLRRAIDQTPRMLAAVRQRGVHVLGHPRGRMLTRQGVLARWDEVFAAAAAEGVAVELDGDPWRQDLDFGLAREALEAGCLFALDSDAHSGPELAYAETALAHARLAGIPSERIVNCWPLERLRAWASERAGPRPRRRAVTRRTTGSPVRKTAARSRGSAPPAPPRRTPRGGTRATGRRHGS